MPKLYGSLLLILFTLVSGACTPSAMGQQPGLEPTAALRASPTATPTTTVIPTPVPTPVPLTAEAIAACPVTQPPDPPFDPPGRPSEEMVSISSGERFWYGSDLLYTTLPVDGEWGQLALGEKVFWWSEHYPGGQDEPEPSMTIRGRRLNDADQTFEQSGATNASHHTFPATAMLHGLTLPTGGCWEITGEYKGEALSFVVWVP